MECVDNSKADQSAILSVVIIKTFCKWCSSSCNSTTLRMQHVLLDLR